MSSWFSSNKFPVDGRTVLLTGGSQGLGLSAGRMLSARGASVVIVARTQSKLDEAIKEIAASAKTPARQRFHAISADVTSPAENARILSEATAWNNGTPPDIIWANAGSAVPTLFLDASVETLRSQMDINYWAATWLAREALRAWLLPRGNGGGSSLGVSEEGKGRGGVEQDPAPRHLIMTSSVAALVSIAGYAPYAPAKAAMRSLHDHLRSELHMYHGAFDAERKRRRLAGQPTHDIPPNTHIHTIFPGSILSPGLDLENTHKHRVTKILEEADKAQTPDEAAAAAISALESGRRLITTQGLLGEAMIGAAWGSSVRDRPVWDTVVSWVVNVVWLGVGWDFRRQIWAYGVREGVPVHAGLAGDGGGRLGCGGVR